MIKNMGEDRVIISLTEDELLDSIANFKALKPMMQDIVRKANGSDTKQGTKDAVELGHDFDVAIEAMTMLVVNIQNVRVGKEVKIQVEDSDISDGRKRKRVEIKKATVAGVYEHFILLHFKVKGNGLQETFFWDDFRKMRR